MKKPEIPNLIDFGLKEVYCPSIALKVILFVKFLFKPLGFVIYFFGGFVYNYIQEWLYLDSKIFKIVFIVGWFFFVGLGIAVFVGIAGGRLVDKLIISNYFPLYLKFKRYKIANNKYEEDIVIFKEYLDQRKISSWKKLDGIQFEKRLSKTLKNDGFDVTETSRTNDGGVDLILVKGRVRGVVQCKGHAKKIPIGTARQLKASMLDFDARYGVIASYEGVTGPTQRYCNENDIYTIAVHDIVENLSNNQPVLKLFPVHIEQVKK